MRSSIAASFYRQIRLSVALTTLQINEKLRRSHEDLYCVDDIVINVATSYLIATGSIYSAIIFFMIPHCSKFLRLT